MGNGDEETLSERERAFLEEHFDDVEFAEDYCFLTWTGSAESLDEIIEKYLSLNSTSFIRAEYHSKEKSHKRYSQKGKLATQIS